ncbi:MAG TPA: UDP-N-acetylmuramoyl-tripeptide--D-alanyl-D-alanine ligase [Solirubrobacteraceae bacterium]|nr:UDP-N-acetylmuramoyl-tripeptide--D-alanyl-D-alanine ligase [Solirubrobacteraceae bacterium]
MTIGLLGALAASVAAGYRYPARVRRMLHLLQLEHYENARLFVWLRRRREVTDAPMLAALVLALVAVGGAGAGSAIVELVAGAAAAAALLVRRRPEPRSEIKPLVFTERARRLFATALAAPAAVLVAGAVLTVVLGSDLPFAIAGAIAVAAVAGAAWALTAANAALAPVQRRINARFTRAATDKLQSVAPRVIGITGSYGKTTTKVCIGAVLSQQLQTLITPASFNSRLGVIRTINELLEPQHEAFVVEMGMYRKGDIAQLCELVHPSIGVLTAIGPVHLERLGSIEAIADAKSELPQALPPGGRLVANGDDPRVREIASRVAAETVLYGLESDDARVRAEEIELADGRTRFTLVIADRRAEVSAGLLGRHNISNLLAAAAVGDVVGIPIEGIAAGLSKVAPPEHRLAPIPNPRAGIIVIDDAYNSNPAGAAAALEVLGGHPAKRRILVTPGMVELGDEEAALNERFGRQAAEVCDHVILVGPERTRPIAAGLVAGGMRAGAITVVRDIGEATKVLGGLTRAGDVILFENDLPDMYAEDNERPTPAPAIA